MDEQPSISDTDDKSDPTSVKQEAERLLQLGRDCLKSDNIEGAEKFFNQAMTKYLSNGQSLDTSTWIASVMSELGAYYFRCKHYVNARGLYAGIPSILHPALHTLQSEQWALLLFACTQLCLIDYVEGKELQFYRQVNQIVALLDSMGVSFDKERRKFSHLLLMLVQENQEEDFEKTVDYLEEVIRKIQEPTEYDSSNLASLPEIKRKGKLKQAALTSVAYGEYQACRKKAKELLFVFADHMTRDDIVDKSQKFLDEYNRIPEEHTTDHDWILIAQHWVEVGEAFLKLKCTKDAIVAVDVARACLKRLLFDNRDYRKLIIRTCVISTSVCIEELRFADFYDEAKKFEEILFLLMLEPFENEQKIVAQQLYEAGNYFLNCMCHQKALEVLQLGLKLMGGIESKTEHDRKIEATLKSLKLRAQTFCDQKEAANQRASEQDKTWRNSSLCSLELAHACANDHNNMMTYLDEYISTAEKIQIKTDYDYYSLINASETLARLHKHKDDERYVQDFERKVFYLIKLSHKGELCFHQIVRDCLTLWDFYNRKNDIQKMRHHLENALLYAHNLEARDEKMLYTLISICQLLGRQYLERGCHEDGMFFCQKVLEMMQNFTKKNKSEQLKQDADFVKLLKELSALVEELKEREAAKRKADVAARKEKKRLKQTEKKAQRQKEEEAHRLQVRDESRQKDRMARGVTPEEAYKAEDKKFRTFYMELGTFEECLRSVRNRWQKWEASINEELRSVPEKQAFSQLNNAYSNVVVFCERIITLCNTASGYQSGDVIKLRECNKECDAATELLKNKKDKLELAKAEWEKVWNKRNEKEQVKGQAKEKEQGKEKEKASNLIPHKEKKNEMGVLKKIATPPAKKEENVAEPKAPKVEPHIPPTTEEERQKKIDALFERVEIDEEEGMIEHRVDQPLGEKLEPKAIEVEFPGSGTQKKRTAQSHKPNLNLAPRSVVLPAVSSHEDFIKSYIDEELKQLRLIAKDNANDFREHHLIRQRALHYLLLRIHLVLAEVYKKQEEEPYKAILVNVDPLFKEPNLGKFADQFCNFLMHRYRTVTHENVVACVNTCFGQSISSALRQRVIKTALYMNFTQCPVIKEPAELIADCEKMFKDLLSFEALRVKWDNSTEHPVFLNAARMTLMIIGEIRARLHEICPELKNEQFARNDPLFTLIRKLEQCRLWRNPEKHESDIQTIHLSFETGNPFVVERIWPNDIEDFTAFAKDIMVNQPGVFKALENKVGNLLTPNVEEAVIPDKIRPVVRIGR